MCGTLRAVRAAAHRKELITAGPGRRWAPSLTVPPSLTVRKRGLGELLAGCSFGRVLGTHTCAGREGSGALQRAALLCCVGSPGPTSPTRFSGAGVPLPRPVHPGPDQLLCTRHHGRHDLGQGRFLQERRSPKRAAGWGPFWQWGIIFLISTNPSGHHTPSPSGTHLAQTPVTSSLL